MGVTDQPQKFKVSSNEARWDGAFETVAPSFDPVELAILTMEAFLDPDAFSEPKADSTRCVVHCALLIRLEAVTTPDTTCLGMPRVVLAARVGVKVSVGTYSGSRSSFDEPIIILHEGATDLGRPLE